MIVRMGINNKTWRTIAAAPLKPPPRARFNAPFRSNYPARQRCGMHASTRTRLLTSTSSASIQPFTNTAISSIASIIQNPLQAYRQYDDGVSRGFDDKSVSSEGICTSSCECWRASSGARSSAITSSSPWRCVGMACQACCDGCEERRSRMDGIYDGELPADQSDLMT
jgi:hypothetical protein